MICRLCGEEIPEGSIICPACGGLCAVLTGGSAGEEPADPAFDEKDAGPGPDEDIAEDPARHDEDDDPEEPEESPRGMGVLITLLGIFLALAIFAAAVYIGVYIRGSGRQVYLRFCDGDYVGGVMLYEDEAASGNVQKTIAVNLVGKYLEELPNRYSNGILTIDQVGACCQAVTASALGSSARLAEPLAEAGRLYCNVTIRNSEEQGYQEAIASLKAAMTAFPENENLPDAIVSRTLAESHAFAEIGEYPSAFGCVDDGLSVMPDDEELLSWREDLQSEYLSHVERTADEDLEKGDTAAASALLQEAENYLPGDDLTDLQSRVLQATPVALMSLPVISSNGSEIPEDYCFDNDANLYYPGYVTLFPSGSMATASYELDGKYSVLDARVAVNIDAGESSGSLMIYADGDLIYSLKNADRSTGVTDIHLSGLAGCNSLTVLTSSDFSDGVVFLLANASVYP